MPKYTLLVNGLKKSIETDAGTPLLYVLRDQLGLIGPKYGCGVAQCGSCMVLLDGQSVPSCVKPISTIGDSQIDTIDGPAKEGSVLKELQQAFVKEQAAQCGYCIHGILITASELLKRNANPTDEEIKTALQLHLCRCGTHTRMIKAIKNAAARL